MLNRRQFLGSSTAALALGALSGRGLAQGKGGRRFLFVHAEGGWDTLAVFAPLFDAGEIDMEPEAEPWSIGNLSLVDSPLRPVTRGFFERHHQACLVLNGVSVRSVNHETCQAVSLTGSTSDAGIDWPTVLAAADPGRFDLPHVVFSGPSFVGDKGVLVSRAEGDLQALLVGDLIFGSDPGSRPLPAGAGRIVDRFLARRAAAVAAAYPRSVHALDLQQATLRAQRLIGRRLEVNLTPGPTLSSAAKAAIIALSDGVCRCATVSTGFNFDTHVDNSLQSAELEILFTTLDEIQEALAITPSPSGGVLADDTVVVVMSEMARTPAYNGTVGRDHWPYTTMMLMGPGVTGGRQIGGYDQGFNGLGVDPGSGDLDPSRPGITAPAIGATLLALGGIDPGAHLPFAQPILGVLT
jgi:hypothetical protein